MWEIFSYSLAVTMVILSLKLSGPSNSSPGDLIEGGLKCGDTYHLYTRSEGNSANY